EQAVEETQRRARVPCCVRVETLDHTRVVGDALHPGGVRAELGGRLDGLPADHLPSREGDGLPRPAAALLEAEQVAEVGSELRLAVSARVRGVRRRALRG